MSTEPGGYGLFAEVSGDCESSSDVAVLMSKEDVGTTTGVPTYSPDWLSDESGDMESYAYVNAGTCPDCGAGMIRLGGCTSCPLCGCGTCGG